MIEIRELSAYEVGLAEVLVDCVAGGASVGFMAGFTQVEAVAFCVFRGKLNGIPAGR